MKRPVGRCIGCFHNFAVGPCGGCGAVDRCSGLDPAYPRQSCPLAKGHGGPCFDNDDPEVDA